MSERNAKLIRKVSEHDGVDVRKLKPWWKSLTDVRKHEVRSTVKKLKESESLASHKHPS